MVKMLDPSLNQFPDLWGHGRLYKPPCQLYLIRETPHVINVSIVQTHLLRRNLKLTLLWVSAIP
jgi:hypothetical protein